MATKSTLRSRLQRRLGLGMVSSVEEERLGEALNAGIARAISDGVPGLTHDTFSGYVLGDLALDSTTATTIGDTTVEVNGAPADDLVAAGVPPQDILVIETGAGTEYKFLIRDIAASTTAVDNDAVDIGVPITAALTGTANSKIIRRGLKLPSTGQVVAVHLVQGTTKRGSRLACEPLYAAADPFAEGQPAYFEQRYSQAADASYISLWPAPATTTAFTVIQTRFNTNLAVDSATLRFPEEALDAVLERARLAYQTWSGNINQVDAALATESVRDTSDALKNSGNARQVFVKQ